MFRLNARLLTPLLPIGSRHPARRVEPSSGHSLPGPHDRPAAPTKPWRSPTSITTGVPISSPARIGTKRPAGPSTPSARSTSTPTTSTTSPISPSTWMATAGWTSSNSAISRRKIVWLKNPGKRGGAWAVNEIDASGPTEFAFLVDLNNDGKAQELLPEFDRANVPLAWFELQSGKWVKHIVSKQSYGHGIGVGDINGDGRNDILTPKGWLEAPADVRAAGEWQFHPTDWEQHPIAPAGAAPAAGSRVKFGFMYVLDINQDGRMDMLTTSAHDYGLMWFEQTADGRWLPHVIDSTWSQAHASAAGGSQRRGQSGPGDRQALHGAQRQRSRRARTARAVLVRVPQGCEGRHRVDPPHGGLRRPDGRRHADRGAGSGWRWRPRHRERRQIGPVRGGESYASSPVRGSSLPLH